MSRFISALTLVACATAFAAGNATAQDAFPSKPIQFIVPTGPGGGTDEKPVGLVYVALAVEGRETIAREFRFGDLGREKVREKTIAAALEMLEAGLK